ncbi:MAG: hypothetical protein J6Y80_07470, partial [Victivallales bacterium]|nr:hypothetical protein [Victivallales bacterium]
GTKDSGDIHSFLGKDRDVPLHVVISTWTDLEGLKKTHAQAFADWKDSEERKGVMKFIGGGNSGFLNAGTDSGGVRYSYIGFTRTEEAGNEFFGYALFVRHAQKVHVVRVEVQLWAKKSQNIVEQHRCERVLRANIVNNRFVSVIPDAVGEWWEGGAQYRERTTLEEDMAEAKPFCSADILAPANFAKVHFLVKNILIKATLQASETDEPEALADLEKAREESLKLLKNLRKNMAEWYGRQRLAYQQAQLEGDRQGRETMNSIQADSEVIISDEFKQEDCRYRRIRRKEWE